MLRAYLFVIFFLFSISLAFSQKGVTTVGIQYKPIISASFPYVGSKFGNVGEQSKQVGDINFKISPQGGFSSGMIVRKGFDKQFSLETGINISKRKYGLTIREDSTGFIGNSNFKYIIYEVPVLGLINVRLGEQFYMNAAFGMAINLLPSDWSTYDDYFVHYSLKKSWINPSLLANLGFEYRTESSGYFYFGFSFNRPFSKLTTAWVDFTETTYPYDEKEVANIDIYGNYLTIDLRYFFHEPPQEEQRKKRR